MIERIHLDRKLEKILAVLRKCGRRERLVADRVEAIIAEVKRGRLPTEEVASFTRNGEGRIRGCRKYDLGAGYRLITLKQGQDLYLLFVGTHDECGRWVENNREHLPLEMITERCRTVERSRPKQVMTGASAPPEMEPEEDWLPPVTDRDLRRVFSGLVGDK